VLAVVGLPRTADAGGQSGASLLLFPIGLTFGLVAGFSEEIGWTGYAAHVSAAQEAGA